MSYFHVLVSNTIDQAPLRCILRDLDEESLASRFLKPYRRGKNLLCDGEVVDFSALRRVVISRTDTTSEDLLERANNEAQRAWHREQDENRRSGVFILSLPNKYEYSDLAHLGTNVTSSFLTDAPSQSEKPSFIAAALSNPWVVGVGGAVIAAGIAAWLQWN